MPSDSPSPPSLRIATYNVEWFTNLFGPNDTLQADDSWSSRYKITRRAQLQAIAGVIKAVGADAMMIIEAPDTGGDRNSVRALQNFAEEYGLRQSLALSGFESHTRQEITLIYDPDVVEVRHAPMGVRSKGLDVVRAPRFDSRFRYDLEVEGQRQVHTFSKPPLEVVLGAASQPDTHLKDPNAALWLDPMQGWALSSARFYHAGLKWYVNTLLDYIMLSPDLATHAEWRIYHPFDDPKCFANAPLKQALLTASDHFPVCVDLAL